MNRGVRHQQIFGNDNSCMLFLELPGEVVERYEIVVHERKFADAPGFRLGTS
ncbi:MAG: hypothetical protein GY854_03860 [Deltaproteobacteria bacterium]|nr:hypothetical protein [Deltaproteobacteria bacterium]